MDTSKANCVSFCSGAPVAVFVNPSAGGGRAARCLPEIRKALEAAGAAAEFVSVADVKNLEARVLAAINAGIRILFTLGGDGSFQGLVNAAYGADVVLGVLPAGGGNDFAAALNVPGNPVAAAAAVLRSEPKYVDAIRVGTGDGRIRLYLGGGGVGIDAEAARLANGTFRRLPGRLRYVASALWAYCGYPAIGVKVEFPGSELEPIEGKVLLAAVLNTPSYGGGIKLASGASLDDGWLDAVIVEELRMGQVLRLLPRLLKSGELPASYFRRFRMKAVKISADRACMFHGDGEILGPAPVLIEVVPHAVRVLAPAQG